MIYTEISSESVSAYKKNPLESATGSASLQSVGTKPANESITGQRFLVINTAREACSSNEKKEYVPRTVSVWNRFGGEKELKESR